MSNQIKNAELGANFLIKKIKNKARLDSVYFILVSDEGEYWYPREHNAVIEGGVCHGSLVNASQEKKLFETVVTYTNQSKLIKENRDLHLRWLDWLTNHSVWSDCILFKDIEYVYDSAFACDMNYPGNFVYGALHMFRNMWEQPQIDCMYMWDRLVQKGLSPEMAVFLSSFAKYSSKHKNRWNLNRKPSGHDALNFLYMDDEDLASFIKKKPVQYKMNKALNEGWLYNGVWSLFVNDVTSENRAFEPSSIRTKKYKEKGVFGEVEYKGIPEEDLVEQLYAFGTNWMKENM